MGDIMTSRELFESALALVGTDTTIDDSLQEYAVKWINLAMAEMFNAENSIRLNTGKKEMMSPLRVNDLDEEIPYDPRFYAAFTYYLAHWIYKDDRELSFAQEMYNRFATEVKEHTMYIPDKIVDVYWGDTDA